MLEPYRADLPGAVKLGKARSARRRWQNLSS